MECGTYGDANLLLLSISVENNASDLVLHSSGQRLDRAVVDSSALAVSAGHNYTVRALRGHGIEGILHKLLARCICTSWERVGGQCSSIVDAFGRNFVGAKLLLQPV